MELHENTHRKETAVLVALDTGEYDIEASIAELRALAESAGAEVSAVITQKRDRPDTATCIGPGKLEELRDFCREDESDLIVFDLELSPTQIRNVEAFTEIRVIDRTQLILDIFANRARSREGILQVELAQLQYALPRLGGKGRVLSRLAGGIGTRGPGESQLETDRRHIRQRIDKLSRDLQDIRHTRQVQRERRMKNAMPTIALIGYTNAGKSTLLNLLCKESIQAKNRLFDTLDTTTRRWRLSSGETLLLSDTVGFIRKLPHHLIEAFKATLEELQYATVLLHVIDASHPEWREQMAVVEALVDELGVGTTPLLRVFNKCDKAPELPELSGTAISAKTGEGVPDLEAAVRSALNL